MTRLTLLAHGATAAQRAPAFPADEPLELRAAASAAALRGRYARTDARSSPALRARQTAEALGLAARIEPALRDLDHGRWSGLAMATVIEREPDAFAAFMTDPDACPHGGESVADLVGRARDWLALIQPRRRQLAVVTHAAFVRAAVVAALDAPPRAFWRIDVPPLSATELVSDGRRWLWRAAVPLDG